MKKRTPAIFLICYVSYVMMYVARLNLSMGAPALKELSVLNTAQIGTLGSVFSVVYACGRLLSGKAADRTAPWKIICAGLILCGGSNLVLSLLPPYPAFLVLWSVNAFAQSMLWGPILRVLSAIYPQEIAQKKASYMGTAVALGNMLAIVLHNTLISELGVQWVFRFPGFVTVILCVLVAIATGRIAPSYTANTVGLFAPLRKKELRQMLLPAMVHGVMKDNISLWMTVYVMDQFGVDLNASAYFILLIPALGFVGRLLAPYFYRLSRNAEGPLLVCSFAVCILCSVLLIGFPVSAFWAVGYLSLIYMAVSVMNACFLAFYPMQYAREGLVASVSGLMDFATYLGTGLSAMVFGVLIDSVGYWSMFAFWGILSLSAIGILLYHHGKEHIK